MNEVIISAEPGYYTLIPSPFTGELRKNAPVLAWNIQRFPVNRVVGTDPDSLLAVDAVTLGGRQDGACILQPDGLVIEPEIGSFSTLETANASKPCADRLRRLMRALGAAA